MGKTKLVGCGSVSREVEEGGKMDEKGSKFVVLERDRRIIKELVGFSGQRACDRRLRKLVQAGYMSRERVLYGVAGIYRITSKGAKLKGLGNARNKIRIEQIRHDIAVLDTAIYFNKKHGIEYGSIRTEIELHRIDGFGIRKHRPDFVYRQEKKTT